jgi:large conductance mechanosensitive channel
MLKEFKEFAVKGNVIDMAVGIIIGVAFGKIVSSVVSDVIIPPIGLIIGGIEFSKLSLILKGAPGDPAAVVIAYGKFIQTVVDFTIVAFVIFMLVKAIIKGLIIKKTLANILAHPACMSIIVLCRDYYETVNNTLKRKEEKAVPPAPAPSKEEALLAEIRDILKEKR